MLTKGIIGRKKLSGQPCLQCGPPKAMYRAQGYDDVGARAWQHCTWPKTQSRLESKPCYATGVEELLHCAHADMLSHFEAAPMQLNSELEVAFLHYFLGLSQKLLRRLPFCTFTLSIQLRGVSFPMSPMSLL